MSDKKDQIVLDELMELIELASKDSETPEDFRKSLQAQGLNFTEIENSEFEDIRSAFLAAIDNDIESDPDECIFKIHNQNDLNELIMNSAKGETLH